MATKTIAARGKQIQVEDFAVINADIPTKRLRATIGSITIESTITFAATDGPRPELTRHQVQKDIDTARLRLAYEAAWREELAQLLMRVS